MADPYRDKASVAREELLALEHERRALDDRVRSLKAFVRDQRDPVERIAAYASGCGVLALVLLVVTICVSTVCTMPRRRLGRVHNAWSEARTIAQLADQHLNCCDGYPRCPGLEELVDLRLLEAAKADDPWGRRYRIACAPDGEVWAYSLGADGVPHTPDDVASDVPRSELETIANLSK